MDPGGSRLDLGGIHPRGCVTAFNPSGSAIRGLWNAPKWPQNAINEANWAISRPGGSSMGDPGGSRLDLGGIHPCGCVTAF